MRTSRTYALYPRETVELLKLIKKCQSGLRLSLDEIVAIFHRSGHDPARIRGIVKERTLAADAPAPPSEALRSAREPAIRRWIRLDVALDNLSVADPLRLNQPAIEELEDLNREYESIPEKELSRLSRIRLTMGKLLAAYALYLVYRRRRHPRTQEIRRQIVQLDPYRVLAQRTSRRSESEHY